MKATGTIYALVDPRDNQKRYIGQTTRTLAERYAGAFAPAVRAWIAELRAAGHRPLIIPVAEDVPAAGLLAAESEEITRILAAGGSLLNQHSTVHGRNLGNQRRETARLAARQAAWRELADAAMSVLGGPLPPGELATVEIPEPVWRFLLAMRQEGDSNSPPSIELLERQEKAARALWLSIAPAWSNLRNLQDTDFGEWLEHHFASIAESPCETRDLTSRHLSLTVWYMVAVHPWRQLAELGALTSDDASFAAWAGRDPGTREGLELLASRRDGQLAILSHRRDGSAGRVTSGLLGAVAAAYSGTVPEVIRPEITKVLEDLAADHMLTRPMADFLARLNPGAVDSVFGRDIAADVDRDLGLPAGTTARVLQEVAGRVGGKPGTGISRVIDRAARELPVAALPDYRGWWRGPRIVTARVVSASLVSRGLAYPDGVSPEEYLSDVRALWNPRIPR